MTLFKLIPAMALTITLTVTPGVMAAPAPEFPDIAGHWAQEVIERAVTDGILTGFEDGNFHPDEEITAAQILTILTDSLSLTDVAEEPQTAAAADAWYFNAARKAVYAGLIDGEFCAFDEPITRLDAFLMTARSLGFSPLEPDLGSLERYSDAAALSESDRPVVAGLTERQLVRGYGGSLHLSETITRAEFMTFFYRMLDFSEEAWQVIRSEQAAEDERVLALINSFYVGDFTLAWAESHDYSAAEKERWVNLMGYDSGTDYLLWVSITHQRLNVFIRTEGNWTLKKCFIVGTGAPGYDTPKGVWKITYKSAEGWTTPSYTVRPVVGFKGGGYAFHSRLCYPGTRTVSDPGIGYPISHGCVRMYEEDIDWLFETIPIDSTVVVY